jgi:hypothetical protein
MHKSVSLAESRVKSRWCEGRAAQGVTNARWERIRSKVVDEE